MNGFLIVLVNPGIINPGPSAMGVRGNAGMVIN